MRPEMSTSQQQPPSLRQWEACGPHAQPSRSPAFPTVSGARPLSHAPLVRSQALNVAQGEGVTEMVTEQEKSLKHRTSS